MDSLKEKVVSLFLSLSLCPPVLNDEVLLMRIANINGLLSYTVLFF